MRHLTSFPALTPLAVLYQFRVKLNSQGVVRIALRQRYSLRKAPRSALRKPFNEPAASREVINTYHCTSLLISVTASPGYITQHRLPNIPAKKRRLITPESAVPTRVCYPIKRIRVGY